MDDGLFVVHMDAIIRDEHARRRLVAFGVDELVQRIHAGQARRLRLPDVLFRLRKHQIRRLILASELPRSGKRVLQRDRR